MRTVALQLLLIAGVASSQPTQAHAQQGRAEASSAAATPSPPSSAETHRPALLATSDSEGVEGLLTDLSRIVRSQESGGWFLDAEAFESIYPTLMQSVCRTTQAARAGALQVVQARAAELGDPRDLFESEGRVESGRFEAARLATRERQALEQALAGATKDCPFWVTPRAGFLGRQTDRKRFTLNVETGGNIQLRRTAGRWTFGGGGLGRILPGFGIGEHLSVLAGVEFGGGAMLRPGGGPQTEFVINYFPAIPVVLRFRDVNWRYDVEVGPVGLFQADNTRLSYGGRIGTSVGLLGLRTRNVIPWAGMAVTYEYYVDSGGRPAAHFLRGGLRVGLIWDP